MPGTANVSFVGQSGTRAQGFLKALERFSHNANPIQAYRNAMNRSLEMRGLAPLHKNTQEVIDDAIVNVGRDRLTLVQKFIDYGLVKLLPDWLGTPILTSHKRDDVGLAQMSMIPGVGSELDGERAVHDYTPYSIPIYCVWDMFEFNVRHEAAANRGGTPIDTDGIEQAVENCNQRVESTLLNGGLTVGGNSTPGLLNTTSIQQFESGDEWTASGKTGADIVTDIQAMVTLARANKRFGPFLLAVSAEDYEALQNDYSTQYSRSILSRITELRYGNQNLDVVSVDLMPADTVLLIELNKNTTGEMVIGQSPTHIFWPDNSGFNTTHMVLTCAVPRIKTDSSGNYAVVKGNTTGT